jgi:hypothetical protein
VEDNSCLLCNENESINHLLSEYCVAKEVWACSADSLDIHMEADFVFIDKWWISREKTCFTQHATSTIL